MIAYYIWDAKSPMILSQFFARMTPLATRIPREPRDMALETSFLVTIPAPHSSSVLFFAFATASAEPLTVFGLCSETDLPVPIRSGGIGLCRTERMFNGEDRIQLFVDMIMAKDDSERAGALEKLGELQRNDFVEILSAMKGRPVTIRLLDPPLHEFLPNPEELADKVRSMGEAEAANFKPILERARELAEVNPMMGHRGVRVAVTYPEIYEMQITAVFEAVAQMSKN